MGEIWREARGEWMARHVWVRKKDREKRVDVGSDLQSDLEIVAEALPLSRSGLRGVLGLLPPPMKTNSARLDLMAISEPSLSWFLFLRDQVA